MATTTIRCRAAASGIAIALAATASSCASKSTADGGVPSTAIFPSAFREAGYSQVRACRAPGEHSGLGGFTVWVSVPAAADYDRILATTPAADAGAPHMPNGATVVKELYRDPECATVDHWVAMQKRAGYDPSHGDWFWQEVAPNGSIASEGRVASCADCHDGRAENSCDGFGNINGKDFLCTAP